MTAGFGLEKMGLWSLRFPRLAAALVVVVTAALLYGATHLGFESDIREIFRSNTPDYHVLEEVARQYPASEQDVLLVLNNANLFEARKLEQLRALHLELMLTDGVTEVLSIFSAREPPAAVGDPAPVVPAELAGVDVAALKDRLLAHPLVAKKLLSDDGNMTLFVISVDKSLQDLGELSRTFGNIKTLAGEVLAGSGFSTALTGMPVMRIEIIDALRWDQLVFKIVGFLFGAALTWLFFRRLRYVLIVGAPVLIAVVWQLGAMYYVAQELNVLTAVVPTLVMVVSFADALHLLFAARQNLDGGLAPREAIEKALRDVGPACVLTSLTTALALMSLMLVPHPFIAGFGMSGAMGTIIAFIATITLFPIAALAILRGEGGIDARPAKPNLIAVGCDVVSRRAADLVQSHAAAITVVSVAIAVLCGLAYAQNVPHHVYKENLPKNNEAYRAVEEIDQKLAGAGTLYLLLRWPDGEDMFTPERRAAIAEAHAILAATPGVGSVWSLKSVIDWFEAGERPADTLPSFLHEYEDLFANRIISPSDHSSLITGYFVNEDASLLKPKLDDLEQRLLPLRDRYPRLEVFVTGIDTVSARASTEMIGQLNRSLAAAIVVIILAIGIATRSARASLVSILPNVLPIAVGGTYLYFSGVGLQFTSVVAFTISFGIAVDSTIHMLNRFRLETVAHKENDAALRATILTVGPVLLVSTIVLVFGLGVTITSVMPTVQLYGRVSVIVLVTALIANMIFLPAILKLTARRAPASNLS